MYLLDTGTALGFTVVYDRETDTAQMIIAG